MQSLEFVKDLPLDFDMDGFGANYSTRLISCKDQAWPGRFALEKYQATSWLESHTTNEVLGRQTQRDHCLKNYWIQIRSQRERLTVCQTDLGRAAGSIQAILQEAEILPPVILEHILLDCH